MDEVTAVDVLREYEAWEAAWILDGSCWDSEFPILNEKLYDWMMAIQEKRNTVLAAPARDTGGMDWTDAQVEAALDEWHNGNDWQACQSDGYISDTKERMRQSLAAAQRASPAHETAAKPTRDRSKIDYLPQEFIEQGKLAAGLNRECAELRDLLSCALGEHDDHLGVDISDNPHWSKRAREILTS